MSMSVGMSREDIERIEQTLFFEQPQLRPRLIRFIMLIFFASVIATGGLISNSSATVIGAMIVAPLMTPIMGMVVALVIGSSSRLVRSAILVIVGIAMSIAIGWLISRFMPGGWNPTTSAQVMSRTSPRLIDLMIALASGGAGAYALSRVDVADALPGVAIAISLVPPLNVVGILLATHDYDLAKGAALLFMTNFAAILMAGTVTFLATGLATGVDRSARDLRRSLIAVAVVVVVIAIPLRINSKELWTDTDREDQALTVINEWLAPTDFEVDQINVDGEEISVLLTGEGQLPPSDSVVAELTDIIGKDMVLTARVAQVDTVVLTGSDDSGGN